MSAQDNLCMYCRRRPQFGHALDCKLAAALNAPFDGGLVIAQRELARARSTLTALSEALPGLRRTHRREPFCPGLMNGTHCTCGASTHNEKVDALTALIKEGDGG